MSKTLKLTNALACLSQYLSPDTFSFIESQVKMSKRSRHAYRWKTEDKMLASIYLLPQQESIQNFIPAVHFTFSKNTVKGPAKDEHKTWL